MKRLLGLIAVVLLIPVFLISGNIEQQIDQWLSKMTMDEKIELIGGTKGFFIKGIPRLGIPSVQMSDGPLGIRANGKSTAFPAGIALAATWNKDLAFKEGKAIGQECREKNIGFILAPAINIYRAAMDGRNFEYFGEDPFLTGQLAANYVKGVQQNKVVATVKHFVANNQEYDRHWVSSNVDERTLHEIYLAGFKTAILQGGALAVMAAYNPLNGVHCSENKMLLTDILKKQWGFKGLVMSDWGAVHSVDAVNAGLDLEMPSAKYMTKENILPLLKSGEVDTATIDDKVRRILRVCLTMNLFDKNRPKPTVDWDAHHQLALQIAREGIVLLKNKSHLLPLISEKIKSIAVLGPNAQETPSSGGGSAHVKPYRFVNFFDAIKQRAGSQFKVDFINTNPYPSLNTMVQNAQFFTDSDLKTQGLTAVFFNNMQLRFPPVARRVDAKINFDFGTLSPAFGVRSQKYGIRWRGYFKVDKSGTYVFGAESDDGVRVYLDDQLILDDWNVHAPKKDFVEKELKKGHVYSLRIDYFNDHGGGVIRFGYGPVDPTPLEQKLASLKNYDAAIVCVGFNAQIEGEGHDRPFALPEEQNRLVKKVANLNDHTIVLLTAGGGIDFSPWIDDVQAVLHTFYMGQAGGIPVAEVLFGDVNPSGKLPFSVPKKWQDAPAYGYYYPKGEKGPIYKESHKNHPVGIDYGEGILTGYRHYDQKDIDPQFPFGFGLSYTKFGYDDLKLSKRQITQNDSFTVEFKLKNKGNRAGAETVQLYIHAATKIPTPPKELKGFKKIFLKPGEEKTVTFTITPDLLQVYNIQNHQWKVEPGKYQIMIGASSRDIRLKKSFLVKP